jgi:hypothetical protein
MATSCGFESHRPHHQSANPASHKQSRQSPARKIAAAPPASPSTSCHRSNRRTTGAVATASKGPINATAPTIHRSDDGRNPKPRYRLIVKAVRPSTRSTNGVPINCASLASKEAYLASQAASLVVGTKLLQTLGALNILIHNLYGTGTLAQFYNQTLASDLAAAHVNAKVADIALRWSAMSKPIRRLTGSRRRLFFPAYRDQARAPRALPAWERQAGANFAEIRRRQIPPLLTSGRLTPSRQASFPTISISPQPVN